MLRLSIALFVFVVLLVVLATPAPAAERFAGPFAQGLRGSRFSLAVAPAARGCSPTSART